MPVTPLVGIPHVDDLHPVPRLEALELVGGELLELLQVSVTRLPVVNDYARKYPAHARESDLAQLGENLLDRLVAIVIAENIEIAIGGYQRAAPIEERFVERDADSAGYVTRGEPLCGARIDDYRPAIERAFEVLDAEYFGWRGGLLLHAAAIRPLHVGEIAGRHRLVFEHFRNEVALA